MERKSQDHKERTKTSRTDKWGGYTPFLLSPWPNGPGEGRPLSLTFHRGLGRVSSETRPFGWVLRATHSDTQHVGTCGPCMKLKNRCMFAETRKNAL